MSHDFYRAFEDRYRGSRDLIKERLRAYLPFVAPLVAEGRDASALDLGCGRGEWLELMSEHAFSARGVDLDDGMLAACRERGLAVETADALTSLRALADDSVAVVSAFHLVEHIPFTTLQELVAQALRVLQPGGLLIMETPNPENPMVGACRFYLDPSHERPLPPLLLSFLTEHTGFARHKVVGLQEDPALHGDAAVRLIQVLDGASPDYGVIAQKGAAPEVLQPFDAAFERPYGIGVTELANRFEHGQQRAVDALAEQLQRQAAETNSLLAGSAELNARLAELSLRQTQYDARLAESNLRITELQTQLVVDHAEHEQQRSSISGELTELRMRVADAETRRAQKEHEVETLQQQLDAVFASTSWRVTAPLRRLRSLFKRR